MQREHGSALLKGQERIRGIQPSLREDGNAAARTEDAKRLVQEGKVGACAVNADAAQAVQRGSGVPLFGHVHGDDGVHMAAHAKDA